MFAFRHIVVKHTHEKNNAVLTWGSGYRWKIQPLQDRFFPGQET